MLQYSLFSENKEMGKGKGENGVMEKHNQKGGWYGKEKGTFPSHHHHHHPPVECATVTSGTLR